MKFFILDNASGDGSVEVSRKELSNFQFPYEIVESKINTGFAGGHNRLLAMHDAEHMLLVNPDLVFESDCIDKLVCFLDEHPEAAGVAPRLMRLSESGIWNLEFGTIDSLGLRVFRSRRVVEIGAGQSLSQIKLSFRPERSGVEESGSARPDLSTSPVPFAKGTGFARDDKKVEVFGLSGACAMFRTSALKDVAFDDGTFLDESYGSYKEDVDLAFRLRSAGHRSFVLFDAVAYHARGAKSAVVQTNLETVKNKPLQPLHVRYNSYKNHLMTLYKNEYWQNLLLDLPWILWYELKKLVYLFLFDRGVLKGLKEVWKMKGELREKRKWIINKRNMRWQEMRRWCKD